MTDIVRSYAIPTFANVGKNAAIAAILPYWQDGLVTVQKAVIRSRFDGEGLPKFIDTKPFAGSSPLSQRQWKAVSNQAIAATKSWEESIKDDVRSLISSSTLSTDTKTWLYRLNFAGKWWAKSGVILSTKDIIGPPDDVLKLARRLIKRATVTHPRPNLSKVRTMLMDGTIAQVEKSNDSTFDYWVRVSTLTVGVPVRIPLRSYQYMESAKGKLSNFAQIRVSKTGDIAFSLVKKSASTPIRTEGETLGLDWGISTLFATSNGQLLGRNLFEWLQERDAELLALTRALQANNVLPRNSKRYQALNRRICEHTKNEIGRVLNQLSKTKVKELVVERLDFRGGGMSSRMNRILNRTARATVSQKLKSLTEVHGIKVTKVNPAYTSQECKCGFTDPRNRKGSQFTCRFCGYKCHADIKAARTIKGRSLNDEFGLWMYRGTIKKMLDRRFSDQWKITVDAVESKRSFSSNRVQTRTDMQLSYQGLI